MRPLAEEKCVARAVGDRCQPDGGIVINDAIHLGEDLRRVGRADPDIVLADIPAGVATVARERLVVDRACRYDVVAEVPAWRDAGPRRSDDLRRVGDVARQAKTLNFRPPRW